MTEEFKPKIKYRMAGFNIDKAWIDEMKQQTPWQYLGLLVESDRAPEHQGEWMAAHLKQRWPGNYTVVRYDAYDAGAGWVSGYKIVFDDPAEETWFRLKWTSSSND